MEKERKITAPEGCEIEKVELVDGVAVVTFREKKRKLPGLAFVLTLMWAGVFEKGGEQ